MNAYLELIRIIAVVGSVVTELARQAHRPDLVKRMDDAVAASRERIQMANEIEGNVPDDIRELEEE